jgi:hypothetical protein
VILEVFFNWQVIMSVFLRVQGAVVNKGRYKELLAHYWQFSLGISKCG